MTETAEQQRTRILKRSPDTEPWEYDLAVRLGYQPDSWAGMWRLIMHPFTFEGGHVIIREVATHHGRAKWRGNRVIYRVRTCAFAQ